MTLWECSGCGCRYTAGAPRCPECPETAHTEVEAGEMPKITSEGVSWEPGHEPEGWVQPEAETEVPAEEEAGAEEAPAVPPAAPPRRAAPPQTEM